MRTITFFVMFLLSSNVLGQNLDTLKDAVGAPMGNTGNVGGDMNFEMIDGDSFVTLNLGFNFDLGKIGFGIQLPLRLKVDDVEPQSDDIGGIVRQEDWDEWTDFLKVIRFFRFGRKGETIFAQVGDLPGAILGHGTIVNRYYNNTDIDHYKMGMQFDVNTDYAGVETLFNNGFVSNLIGARAYLKPWSFVDPEAYLNNLAIGFTIVSDYSAPYCMKNASGNCIPDQSATADGSDLQPVFDDDGNLLVAQERAATVIGGDIEFRVLNSSYLSLVPYIDVNAITNAGLGFHAGIMSVFHVPVVSIDLSARIEYRYFEGDYIPAYFDSFYEIQKFGYPFHDQQGVFGPAGQDVSNRPKRRVLDELPDEGLNGYYAELVIDLMGLAQLGAAYDDYDGLYNSNLRVHLSIPALKFIQFGAFYYRHNYEGASEAFKFDDKSLFLVEARYQIASFIYLIGQYWRIWQLDKDINSEHSGEYVAVDDWSVGIGFSYAF